MDRTAIEWCDSSWNPLRGCRRVSAGCKNCYAERIAARFSGPGQPYESLAMMTPKGPRWSGRIRLLPELLYLPLRWKRERIIFVNSTSDLFHEQVPESFVVQVLAVVALAARHRFVILTKRAARMRTVLNAPDMRERVSAAAEKIVEERGSREQRWNLARRRTARSPYLAQWPLPNACFGVSVEDQGNANRRVPYLLATPARYRLVSYEPALGTIDFTSIRDCKVMGSPHRPLRINAVGGLDWIIAGGESGPDARPCNIEWFRAMIRQRKAAGVRVFVKQLGAKPFDSTMIDIIGTNGKVHYRRPAEDPMKREAERTPGYSVRPMKLMLRDRKGGDPSEWPAWLRVREYPRFFDGSIGGSGSAEKR